ncbi:23480_t:CDS:2, partial [Racocetra persica]
LFQDMSDNNIVSSSTVTCIICKNEYSSKISTSILRKHLDTQHQGWSTIKIFALMQNNSVSIQNLIANQKAQFNLLLAEWIVTDTLPFSIVKTKVLIALLQYLNA